MSFSATSAKQCDITAPRAARERVIADVHITTEIERARIATLNDGNVSAGAYVLYWMQQSQRVAYNHALELAVQLANELKKPLIAGFGLHAGYPEANARHFTFLLEGLSETSTALRARGIRLVVRRGRPDEVAHDLGADACAIVCDRGYLRHQKEWRADVAKRAGKYVVQVESDVLVPVRVASEKAEHAARTLRPKLQRAWPKYLSVLRPTELERSSTGLKIDGINVGEPERVLADLTVDRTLAPVNRFFRGGASEAGKRLERFVAHALRSYIAGSRQPEAEETSTLSPYLHYGQISPIEIALAACGGNGRNKTSEDADKFLDELLVRRELACNFTEYVAAYDTYGALPAWARRTLGAHARDRRPYRYDKKQLEAADTHDRYWNAAMREMQATGFLHNYMRMYWGKKILEWSDTPELAYRHTLELNNKYFLDGRDPASYANVGWIFGLHDRPWFDRPIFGTVRYMAASGLERKLDMDAYLARVDERVAEGGEAHR